MSDLTGLPNIGSVLAAKLEEVGINKRDDLAAVGSVGAVLKVRGHEGSGCYNMLYALEGAIRGCRWHSISRDERNSLREQFDNAVKSLAINELE